jgi:CubicO group peptidase (beta-lactamase class C family)
MKRLLALLLLLLLPASALAADYCDCPDTATHARRQEALDRVLYGYQTMGASIALVKDGRIIDTFQYGRANRADNIPVDSDTYFRIASVTKMVSAVGILQLVEEGVLELDRDVGEYFPFTSVRNPYFPDTPITLRQIMSHTASLSDDYHYVRATAGDITSLTTVFEGKRAKDNFQKFEPGTRADYSNFGGGLLGAILEQQTANVIDEYMNWNVFLPLGFIAGYHTPTLPEGAKIARIYNIESTGMTLDPMSFTEYHMDPEPEFDYTHTAGALCITAEGLAKVIIALAGDGSVDGVQILKPETVEMMRTRQAHIGSVTCDSERGLNLNIIKDALVQGRTLYGHQGKAYGMICAAYFDPTDQTGVVLLTNGCDDSTFNSVARIARSVLSKAYEYLE